MINLKITIRLIEYGISYSHARTFPNRLFFVRSDKSSSNFILKTLEMMSGRSDAFR